MLLVVGTPPLRLLSAASLLSHHSGEDPTPLPCSVTSPRKLCAHTAAHVPPEPLCYACHHAAAPVLGTVTARCTRTRAVPWAQAGQANRAGTLVPMPTKSACFPGRASRPKCPRNEAVGQNRPSAALKFFQISIFVYIPRNLFQLQKFT
jgi:hypothetical protein